MTQEGRSYSFHHGEPNSLGTLFWRFRKFPDKDRIEVTKKRDVIEIYTGDKGYEITYRGVRDMDDKEMDPTCGGGISRWMRCCASGSIEPGVALFYEGQTVAAQKQAEQVTVMNAKNEAVTLYFDSSTHLPVKKSFTWRDPVDKQRNVEEEIYDNYRPAQNIMMPYDTTRFFNGEMSAQFFLTSASIQSGTERLPVRPQEPLTTRTPLSPAANSAGLSPLLSSVPLSDASLPELVCKQL